MHKVSFSLIILVQYIYISMYVCIYTYMYIIASSHLTERNR